MVGMGRHHLLSPGICRITLSAGCHRRWPPGGHYRLLYGNALQSTYQSGNRIAFISDKRNANLIGEKSTRHKLTIALQTKPNTTHADYRWKCPGSANKIR